MHSGTSTSATLRRAQCSPQKVRMIADLVRGLPVERALDVLFFSNKKAAGLVRKVLNSAITNAEHNNAADIDSLWVQSIQVDAGPTQRRLRLRARGRADRLLKRSSHITIEVAEKARQRGE